MSTPLQIEDALRRSGVGTPAPEKPPAPPPSQAGFTKAWSPEDKAKHQQLLLKKLRER